MDNQLHQVHDFDLNLPAKCEGDSCASVAVDAERISNESWSHRYPTLTLVSLSPEFNRSEPKQEASDTSSKLRSFFPGNEKWLSLSLPGQDSGEQIPLAPSEESEDNRCASVAVDAERIFNESWSHRYPTLTLISLSPEFNRSEPEQEASDTSSKLRSFFPGNEKWLSLSLPGQDRGEQIPLAPSANSQQAGSSATSSSDDQHSSDSTDRSYESAVAVVRPPFYADRVTHFWNLSLLPSGPTSEDPPNTKPEGNVQDKVKEKLITPPYAWATDKRAVVHPLEVIIERGIINVEGFWKCKRCDGSRSIAIDLQAGFLQLDEFFTSNKESMHVRAPANWTAPPSLDCEICGQKNCVKPDVVHRNIRKRNINWLYLGLSENLGFCTLHQLKYFSKHTQQKHRTGAKNRLLYQTYQELLKQLNPKGLLEGRYDLEWEKEKEEEEEERAPPQEI